MKTLAYQTAFKLATIAACGVLVAAPTSSWAQEKFKYSFKDPGGLTKYTQQHVIDVGDVAGHQIRVASLQTKYVSEAPMYDGVKVVEGLAWLASDYVGASGRFTTYGVSLMANGDKIFTRGEGLAQTSVGADGSRRTSFSQVTTLTGGTGKFAAIRGTLRGSGVTDFKTGTSGNVIDGEYWFEK